MAKKKAAKKTAKKAGKKKKLAGKAKATRVVSRKNMPGYAGGLKLDKKEQKLMNESNKTAEGRAMMATNLAASGARRWKRSEGGAGGE